MNSARKERRRGQAPRVHISWLALCAFFVIGMASAVPAAALDPQRAISQYAHTAWRVQDGVFSGTPNAIAQTTDGYIWIGTQTELIRFDGVRFVRWTPPEGRSLPNSSIYSLLGAHDGSLWIGGGNTLSRWRNDDLINYADTNGRVNSVLEDQKDGIWIARSRVSDGGGPVCRVEDKKLRCYGSSDGIPFPYGGLIVQDKFENLWIETNGALCRWKPGSTCRNYFVNQAALAGGGIGLWQLASGPDGSIWTSVDSPGAGRGVQQFAEGVWKRQVLPQSPAIDSGISTLFVDRDNVLWIGTIAGGIYRILNGNADHFGSGDGLSSDSVQSFFQDREGNLWVVTSAGIDRFHNLPVVSFSIRQGLTAEDVGSVLSAHDGTLWIGNRGGLDFLPGDKPSAVRTVNRLPGRRVTSLLEDHEGRLWVGLDSGLNLYEAGTFVRINRSDGSVLGGIIAITEDADHTIWAEAIGNPSRLVRIQDGQVREEIAPPRIPRAKSLAADPKGGIWLGLTNGDLARYRKGRLEIFPKKQGADNQPVQNLLADADGSIWAATANGLMRWKDGKAEILSSRNDLPCDSVLSVLRDQSGSIWLYTNCGVVAIADSELGNWWEHPDAKVRFRVFDAVDGAQPAFSDFRPSAARSRDGRLWFVNGSIVQMVDPERLYENRTLPPIQIEKIVADRRSYAPREDLHLPSLTRDLEIDYTALSFVAPQKVRFRYKLDGRDANWQDPQGRRQAFYSDLRPGKYRFRVIACNNDGVWNEAGASLGFTLLPAFYQTNWFLLICLAAFGGIAWAGYQWHVRQLAARLDSQFEERLAERTRIAQDLHDTLLQGILSAKMQLHVANDQLPEDWPAKPTISRVLELMGGVIDDGRKAVRGLRSSPAESDDLEQSFSRIPHEIFLQQLVDFRVIVEGQVRPLHPVIRDEVYRIGHEALANAFRHSRASCVEVELKYADDQLRVLVRDNGCGIDPQVLRAGREGHWGLSGMRERAERIGARVKVWSRPAGGTEVELSVPGYVAFRHYASGRGPRWFGRLYPRKVERDIRKPGSESKE
ncbi:MAG: two-component regulator propeller domain-containing protein [Candidatus Sulfotelmatobacter sp.]